MAPIYIVTPSENDVLFGRGKAFQNHNGNKILHNLVDKCLQAYLLATLQSKNDIIEDIVCRILEDIGGRFLRRSGETGSTRYGITGADFVLWEEVSMDEARKKVAQTIRSRMRSNKTQESVLGLSTAAAAAIIIKSASVLRRTSLSTLPVGSKKISASKSAACDTRSIPPLARETKSLPTGLQSASEGYIESDPSFRIRAPTFERTEKKHKAVERQIHMERLECQRRLLDLEIKRRCYGHARSMALPAPTHSPSAFGVNHPLSAPSLSARRVPSQFLTERLSMTSYSRPLGLNSSAMQAVPSPRSDMRARLDIGSVAKSRPGYFRTETHMERGSP